MIQIYTFHGNNQRQINKELEKIQIENPTWEIISISLEQVDFPAGWFVTITYRKKD